MKVTFCGHGDVWRPDEVRHWLYKTVENLIVEEAANIFLLGGYGAFDHIASSVIWELKKKYSQIESILVLPYLNKKVDEGQYDITIYPALEKVPKRYAIPHRNRYMVNDAEVVIAYVRHSWGGAAQTLEYAKKKKKRIILYEE